MDRPLYLGAMCVYCSSGQGGQPSPGPRLVDVKPAVYFTQLSLFICWFITDALFIELPWQFSFGTYSCPTLLKKELAEL